jgi:hypothetical protein
MIFGLTSAGEEKEGVSAIDADSAVNAVIRYNGGLVSQSATYDGGELLAIRGTGKCNKG